MGFGGGGKAANGHSLPMATAPMKAGGNLVRLGTKRQKQTVAIGKKAVAIGKFASSHGKAANVAFLPMATAPSKV